MDKAGKAYTDKAIIRSVRAPVLNRREAYIGKESLGFLGVVIN